MPLKVSAGRPWPGVCRTSWWYYRDKRAWPPQTKAPAVAWDFPSRVVKCPTGGQNGNLNATRPLVDDAIRILSRRHGSVRAGARRPVPPIEPIFGPAWSIVENFRRPDAGCHAARSVALRSRQLALPVGRKEVGGTRPTHADPGDQWAWYRRCGRACTSVRRDRLEWRRHRSFAASSVWPRC